MSTFKFNTAATESNSNSSSQPTGIAALYPPQSRDKDTGKSVITGFAQGCGLKGFTKKEGISKKGNPYCMYQLTLFLKSDAGETKDYSLIINDFFEIKPTDTEANWNKRVAVNVKHILDIYYTINGSKEKADGTLLIPAFDASTLEEFVYGINSHVTELDYNPDVKVKIVYQKNLTEKAQYNLSSNYPIVESPLFNHGKLKFNPPYDVIEFNPIKSETDGLLGSNDFTIAAPSADLL